MKASELMIGDWVYCKPHKKYAKVYRIDQANGEGNGWIAAIDGDFSEDRYEPIPLTKEILEKNGFDLFDSNGFKVHYIYFKNGIRSQNHISVIFYDDKSILVQMENKSLSCDGVNKVHNCDIHYIHELQHTLRLCGIEKEIVV